MITVTAVIPLDRLPPGARGEIVDVAWRGHGFLHRLYQMGLTPGTVVEVVANYGRGPLIVRVRGVETAIGRGIASRILVRVLR